MDLHAGLLLGPYKERVHIVFISQGRNSQNMLLDSVKLKILIITSPIIFLGNFPVGMSYQS